MLSISGAVLIMDNVRFHHKAEVLQKIEDNGHRVLFLPPYSPFHNLIENLFNQLKHHVKRMKPNTADDVFYGLEHASDSISRQDCINYFRNMSSYLQKSLNRESISN